MKSFKDYISEAEITLTEKAVSKQQQKFMGMAHAIQKGEKVKGASPELKKVAKSMKKSDVTDFAKTKHKGLPKKVSESALDDNTPGSAFNHVLDRFKHEVKQFRLGNELDNDLYEALFDYYSDTGEMPYGIAKARTGDPFTWVSDRFANDIGLEEAVRPEDIPAVHRKQQGADFPVSMPQIQDKSDTLSDLQSLRARAGMPPSGTSLPPAATVGSDDSKPMGMLDRIRKLSGI